MKKNFTLAFPIALAFVFLASCEYNSPPTIVTLLPPTQTAIPPTATPPTTTPTSTSSPLSALGAAPTPIPGWLTYTNDYLGYTFNHPSGAIIDERGAGGMDTNEVIPPGFTYWDYFDYVMALLPGNLCVSVSLPGAFITIAPPYNPIGSYLGPCPGMGIGTGYTFKTADETLIIAGQEYHDTQGTKLYLESNGAFYAEFYMFDLKNGFRVIWNGRPAEGMSEDDYLTQRTLAVEIIATLHWFRIPDLTKPGTTCAGAYTHLVPGVKAVVVGQPDDPPNRVRSGPSPADEIVYQIYPQTVVKIMAGPVCADGLVFWQVEYARIPGGTGWTAEGDGVDHWLEPYHP
jgi:hypothetical protein